VINGLLDRLHFGDLLQWFQMGSVRGRLTLTSRKGERRFDFRNGSVCFVSSTDPEERLASWIARRSQIDLARLRRILAVSMLRRELFTDLLLAEGVVDEVVLKGFLTELAESITGKVLLSPEVEFSFDPDYPVLDVLGLSLDVKPSQLLMEAARRTDEREAPLLDDPDHELPLDGEAFETFFWDLVRDGIAVGNPVDGQELRVFHDQVQNIVDTVAQWVASSSGLVPMPASQIAAITRELDRAEAPELFGQPHASWNQMVLARSLHGSPPDGPHRLAELESIAGELDVWSDMVGAGHLVRPDAGRLDRLIRRLISLWARTAAAAAPHLGVDPVHASLAVHLATVPTDLVLWVLTTVPVSHPGIRRALLKHLSRRVGGPLAKRADFPPVILAILNAREVTPLGISLDIGRRCLPAASAWPANAPEVPEQAVESAGALAEAWEAAQEAAEQTDADFMAVQ
jgi:hypothetical protein